MNILLIYQMQYQFYLSHHSNIDIYQLFSYTHSPGPKKLYAARGKPLRVLTAIIDSKFFVSLGELC